MAEKTKAKSGTGKARAKKATETSKRKSAAKAAGSRRSSDSAGDRRRTSGRRSSDSGASGFDVAKLIDHPLVADLLAVGAMAAVAAIADHNVKTRTGESESGSGRAVKAAGKAAAAAIGKRLMSEVDAVRKAAKDKDAKAGPG
jgi:hypothetical protein